MLTVSEFVLNRKTASWLGIALPKSVRVRAEAILYGLARAADEIGPIAVVLDRPLSSPLAFFKSSVVASANDAGSIRVAGD